MSQFPKQKHRCCNVMPVQLYTAKQGCSVMGYLPSPLLNPH